MTEMNDEADDLLKALLPDLIQVADKDFEYWVSRVPEYFELPGESSAKEWVNSLESTGLNTDDGRAVIGISYAIVDLLRASDPELLHSVINSVKSRLALDETLSNQLARIGL